MKRQRSDGQETRISLLEAASSVFAKKGYWETTNVDICEIAKTNTASVNYHFGSKEDLYIEAWKYSFEKSLNKYPLDGGIPKNASVEKRLRGRILSFMQRIADPESFDMDIIHKEMANPTGLLSETIEKTIEPTETGLKLIIMELLGVKSFTKQAEFCMMSIMGQCFGPMLHLRHSNNDSDNLRPKRRHIEFSIDELADHIIQFSLEGILGIRHSNINKKKKV